ncbi:10397_t:CDS:10 [Rhizophagus irregularis]|nr:10397_t:CDS:10 [Rhizophagus irregularis]
MRSKTSERTPVQVDCPHIHKIIKKDSPLAKIESSSFKKQITNSSLHCDICETRAPKLWICLHNRCRAVVCHTSSKSHMRNHFDKENRDDSCHSIFVNPHTLKILCHACSSELNPFGDNNFLTSEARTYLKTVIRYLQMKRNKSQISIDQIPIDVPGLVGLKNLGNTCYANAALQCLSNTPALADFFNYCDAYIPQILYISKHPNYKLGEYFGQFVKAMWNGTSPIFVPVQLMNEIRKYNEVFRGHGQQDSMEFLRCVLDILHEELPYPQFMPGKVSKNGECIYMNQTISTSTSSNNSHNEYLKEENFYDLQIQIDKKFKLKSMNSRVVRLQDCLSSFCAIENLTGEDKYRCDKCESLNDCQKRLRITRLPETLCIQLKRFRYESCFSSKIATHVQFPMEDLDMRPYCKDLSNEKGNPELADTLNITKYDLYGLIHHRGVLGGGHYIAYVKNPIDKNWYEYDDTFVTRKSEADISRLEAFVLFYHKKGSEKDRERTEMSSKINGDSTAETCYFISRLWFNRWQFMTAPGPITNYDFICPHGGVNTRRYPNIHNMVVKVPFSVYTTFVNKYGTDGSLPFHSADNAISGCTFCEQEEKILEQRRRKEDEDIRKIDTNSIKRGEYWFLISAPWLLRSPPGPIDNYHFLNEDGSPKVGMERGINERVWSYFEHVYGGGPVCVRNAIDLYAPNPLISDYTKHGKSSKTKWIKNDIIIGSTIGLISLASFSDNGLRFRDVRRTHASFIRFIREAGNFASKLEYA